MSRDSTLSDSRWVWEKLRIIAMADGVITEEENHLISNIVLDVEAYSLMTDTAFEDGIINEFEKMELFEGRIEILEKAYAIARNDQHISPDEINLLKSIVKLVTDFNKRR